MYIKTKIPISKLYKQSKQYISELTTLGFRAKKPLYAAQNNFGHTFGDHNKQRSRRHLEAKQKIFFTGK